MNELLARLGAAIRRGAPGTDEPVVMTPRFSIDMAAKRVTLSDGHDVRLAPIEWQHRVELLARNRRAT